MDNDAGILSLKDGRQLWTRTTAQQRSSDGSAKSSIEPGGEPPLSVRAKEDGTPLERSRFVALIRQRVAPIAALAVGGLVIALVDRLSRDLDYHAIIGALRQVPVQAVGLSVAATVLSFVALIGREFCAARYAVTRVPVPILLIASFCGNALGNAVGFGALSGGAVRYRLYRSVGMAPEAIGRIVAFIAIGSGIDVAIFTAASSLVAAPQIGELLPLPVLWMEAIAWLIVAAAVFLVILFAWERDNSRLRSSVLTLPTPLLFVAQLVLVGVDVITPAGAAWVLLRDERVALLPISRGF